MNIRLIFLVIATLSAISCRDETPYVAVGPHFYVEHNIQADGSVTQLIRVDLFTGDLAQYAELKDGSMTVNGEPMILGSEEHELPIYSVPEPIVASNTGYKFEIGLADGRKATAEVTTQEKPLTELAVPASVDTQHDAAVSWPVVDNHDQMVLSVYYTMKNSTEEQLAASFKLKSEEISSGSYVIPRETFIRSNIRSARIQLIGYRVGTTTNFKDGGRIVSKMTVEKVIEVK